MAERKVKACGGFTAGYIMFKFIEDGGITEGNPGGKGEMYINGKIVDELEMHISTFSLSETFMWG